MGCKRQTNRVFIAVMTSSLTRRLVELLDQNIFPTLVLARQDGQRYFQFDSPLEFHDTNSSHLILYSLWETPPIILKIGSKIVIVHRNQIAEQGWVSKLELCLVRRNYGNLLHIDSAW